MYTNVKSLCSTLETNIMCQLYLKFLKKEKTTLQITMNWTLGPTGHICYLSKSLQFPVQKVPAGTSKWQCQDEAPEVQLQNSNSHPPSTLQGHLWCHLVSLRMRNSTDSVSWSCLLCFYLIVLLSHLEVSGAVVTRSLAWSCTIQVTGELEDLMCQCFTLSLKPFYCPSPLRSLHR